jgi:hypothetical protein
VPVFTSRGVVGADAGNQSPFEYFNVSVMFIVRVFNFANNASTVEYALIQKTRKKLQTTA